MAGAGEQVSSGGQRRGQALPAWEGARCFENQPLRGCRVLYSLQNTPVFHLVLK